MQQYKLRKLNERDRRVIYLLAQGYSNHEIASVLHFSPDTIKCQLSKIMKKLDANNRAHAVSLTYGSGLFKKKSLIKYFKDKI